jgi:hypothetical protein
MLEWVSVEGGFEGNKLLRSQLKASVYSVCATIEGIVRDRIEL